MREIRNLMTDPWPNGTAGWDIISGTTGNVEFRMCNEGRAFMLKRLTADPADIMISRTLTGLKAGTYVAALQLIDYYESVADNGVVLLARQLGGISNYGSITAKQRGARLYTQFTLPADGGLRIVLQPPAAVDAYYAVNRLLLMTQEDWDTMRNLKNDDGTAANICWFAPPKDAATGVMSTPALDRGGCGALLVLAAIIHTLMWRWQHDGDAESEPGPVMPEEGMVEGQLGDSHAMLGQPVEIHEHQHLEELGVRRRTENGRGSVRACPVRNRRDRQQTIKLPDLHHQQRGQCVEGHDLGHPLLDRRDHEPQRGIGSRDTDQLRDPRHEAARLCGLHPGGLDACAGTARQQRATQIALPVVGYANGGHAISATAPSAHTLSLAARLGVAA